MSDFEEMIDKQARYIMQRKYGIFRWEEADYQEFEKIKEKIRNELGK